MIARSQESAETLAGRPKPGQLTTVQPVSSCCGPAEQSACCEPAAKEACCDTAHPQGCGCK
jgi:hypothetical protein